jgi:hypothetical protein
MVTLGEAARLTGLSKTGLARAIKSGRLSATRTDTGSYEIDPAELSRVYPVTVDLARSSTPGDPAVTAALEAQIQGLRDVSELLRRQLEDIRQDRDDLRQDRDAWRSQAERLAIADERGRAPAEQQRVRRWWPFRRTG